MNLFSLQNQEFTRPPYTALMSMKQNKCCAPSAYADMDELIGRTVPAAIRMDHPLNLPGA